MHKKRYVLYDTTENWGAAVAQLTERMLPLIIVYDFQEERWYPHKELYVDQHYFGDKLIALVVVDLDAHDTSDNGVYFARFAKSKNPNTRVIALSPRFNDPTTKAMYAEMKCFDLLLVPPLAEKELAQHISSQIFEFEKAERQSSPASK
jgi:hypothetical protein